MNLKQQFRESAFSSKDTFLKCEEMENGKTYAITYSPADQPDIDAPRSLLDWLAEQKDIFKTLKGCVLRLYLEVSKTGRHHFHGLIRIINRVKFCVYDVAKLIKYGSTCIKTIGLPDQCPFDQYAEWIAYCLKQQNDINEYIMEQLLPSHKLMFRDRSDDFLLFPKIK